MTGIKFAPIFAHRAGLDVYEMPEPAQPHSTPAELVARIRAGERTAEEELVARYSRGVSVILRRLAGRREVAEDLYQDVFLAVMVKIRDREVRDRKGSRAISVVWQGIWQLNTTVGICAPALLRVRTANRLQQPRAARSNGSFGSEDARAVKQVLADLSLERDRQLLYRFYVGEDDKEEICRDLKLTSLQFNRVLHRARERFRELFESAAGRVRNKRAG